MMQSMTVLNHIVDINSYTIFHRSSPRSTSTKKIQDSSLKLSTKDIPQPNNKPKVMSSSTSTSTSTSKQNSTTTGDTSKAPAKPLQANPAQTKPYSNPHHQRSKNVAVNVADLKFEAERYLDGKK
jgi:hypothetical protein